MTVGRARLVAAGLAMAGLAACSGAIDSASVSGAGPGVPTPIDGTAGAGAGSGGGGARDAGAAPPGAPGADAAGARGDAAGAGSADGGLPAVDGGGASADARDPFAHLQPGQPLPPTAMGGGFPVIPAQVPAGEITPGAGQECPAWLHDAYRTLGPDGAWYRTWHPVTEPTWKCVFRHEHGSDPRAYAGFGESGMPAFGYTQAKAGFVGRHPYYASNHNQQKVMVASDDAHGHPFMIVASLGGTTERGQIRWHALDWHVSDRAGKTLVNLHVMADYGTAEGSCGGKIPGSTLPDFAGAPAASGAGRFIYTPACAGGWEHWATEIRLGSAFAGSFQYSTHNATTAVDPQDPTALHFMCEYKDRATDCRSPRTFWNSSERAFNHWGMTVRNASGSALVSTDAIGRPVAQAQAAFVQYVTTQGFTTSLQGNLSSFAVRGGTQGIYQPDSHGDVYITKFGDGVVQWPN